MLSNVVNYFQNELGTQFNATRKLSEALEVPQNRLYPYILDDPNRVTDKDYRRNITWSKVWVTKNTLHCLRQVKVLKQL